MPDRTLDCAEFRARIDGFLAGAQAGAAFEAHAAECGQCLERLLDAALANPAEAPVPAGFAARTLARLPAAAPSVLPYAIAAACLLFALLAAWALHTGLLFDAGRWLAGIVARRPVLAAIAAFEIGGSFVWAWRAART